MSQELSQGQLVAGFVTALIAATALGLIAVDSALTTSEIGKNVVRRSRLGEVADLWDCCPRCIASNGSAGYGRHHDDRGDGGRGGRV